MVLQRGSGVRIKSDASAAPTGFLKRRRRHPAIGRGNSQPRRRRPTGLNQVYMTSFDKGVVQTGAGGQLTTKNVNVGNTTTPWTLASDGWTRR
jgi:hypothetical protein